jgi:hypothetical protein
MTPQEQQNSSRILDMYNSDLEKGGKRAEIGEVRTWAGQQWVKHSDGWVHYNQKTGKHLLELPGGKRQPAEPHHIEHAKKSLGITEKPQVSTNSNIVDYAARMFGTNEYPVINKILIEVQPKLDAVVEATRKFCENHEPNPLKFDERDKEYCEIETIGKLLSSLGKYIKKTDKIPERYPMTFSNTAKGVEIKSQIERDGKVYNFDTDCITAGGYNIQAWHYRYLIKTDLPAIHNPFTAKIENRVKAMKKEDKLVEEIKRTEGYLERTKSEYEKIKDVTKEISDKEWEDKYHYPKTYEETNEGSHLREIGPERFYNYIANEKVKHYERIQEQVKYLPKQIKQQEKEVQKYKDKLEETIKNKWNEIDEPKEGDLKIIRDRQNYGRQPGIHLHKFENGNYKKLLTTYGKNVRSAGFDPYKDEDIIKYHNWKKENPDKPKD